MVQLMRTGMVQVLTLQVNTATVLFRQAVAVVNRCGTTLVMLANATQLRDEVVRLADSKIGVIYFFISSSSTGGR